MRVPPVSAAKHNGAGSDLVLNDCLAYQRFGRLLAPERRLLRSSIRLELGAKRRVENVAADQFRHGHRR